MVKKMRVTASFQLR